MVLLDRYDGQLFVKPPEILGRDRLLGTYQVGGGGSMALLPAAAARERH